MRVFTTHGLVSAIVGHGARKFRALKTLSGEYRYQIKDLTDAEYSIFDGGEDLTDQEIEARIEPGGWSILDSFTASAVKQMIEALSETSKATVDRVRFTRLVDFTWKHVS